MGKVFVLGVPCSGKTAAASELRASTDLVVLDMDDEVVALNGGVWPDIEAKNTRWVPQVLDSAASQQDVVLFNSYSLIEWTRRLRGEGFTIVLLDIRPEEQLRRDAVRSAEEGWTNREWFDWHRSVVAEHDAAGLFDQRIDADRPLAQVVGELADLARSG